MNGSLIFGFFGGLAVGIAGSFLYERVGQLIVDGLAKVGFKAKDKA